MIRALLTAALLLLPAMLSAQQSQEAPSVAVGANWGFGGFAPSQGSGRVNYAIAALRQSDGSLMLCGVMQFAGMRGGVARQVPRAMQLEANGRRLVTGFGWMPIIRNGTDLVGQEAACRVYPAVQVPANPSYGVSLSRSRF